MTPEISILKHILNYENWQEASDKLSIQDFSKDTQLLFSGITNYHSGSSDPCNLTVSDLTNLVFSGTVKNPEFIAEVIKQVDQCDAHEGTTTQLIDSLHSKRRLKELSLLAYEVAEGRQEKQKLETFLQSLPTGLEEQNEEQEFITNDLQFIVDRVIAAPGLRWRLKTLNEMLGSLRKGNFGFIVARPETGKTTFLSSEVSFMAEQLSAEDGPILWFNNEQVGEEVLLRIYQASLGRDTAALLSNVPVAQAEYLEKTHDKLKLIDRGTLHYKFIEQLAIKYKPSLIIVDQLDAVAGFDADRKDLQLGAIYRWFRELAKQYCPVIGVCQADGTGEGVRWLTMSHVADAKTAKQAHADWILGIGKVPDPGYDNLRFLHLSKNKLLGDSDTVPDQRHGRREVLIEPMIARYKDIG